MIAVQLASFFLAVECLVLLFIIPRGLASSILALLFLIFILIFSWTVRASDDEKGSS